MRSIFPFNFCCLVIFLTFSSAPFFVSFTQHFVYFRPFYPLRLFCFLPITNSYHSTSVAFCHIHCYCDWSCSCYCQCRHCLSMDSFLVSFSIRASIQDSLLLQQCHSQGLLLLRADSSPHTYKINSSHLNYISLRSVSHIFFSPLMDIII